jgi:biopolymer transport protein TolQ
MGYNQLTSRLREFAARMDDFGRELLNAIENAALVHPPQQPPQQQPLAPASAQLLDEPRRRAF